MQLHRERVNEIVVIVNLIVVQNSDYTCDKFKNKSRFLINFLKINFLNRFCIFIRINNVLFISIQYFTSQYEQEQSEYHESLGWKNGNDIIYY